MPSHPSFPDVRLPLLRDVTLPPVLPVRLSHPHAEPLTDRPTAVRAALARSARLGALPRGASVAVAVGSRGIAHLPEVVAAAVAWLKEQGLAPFVVPAMGSHGGATAEGQTQVLARLGVTEETVGAPLRATMEVVELGRTPTDALPCYFDAHAARADAVLAIARVKSHTTFDRPVESGLCKMLAVGLGKDRGARTIHSVGPRGMSEVIPQMAAMAIERAPVAFGLALVENAGKELVTVEGVEPRDFAAADERLLTQAKSLLARLPFERLDALIVEWIGKQISGGGMDFAVTGRADIRGVPNPEKPFVTKLGLLGVTPESGGNAIGIGFADFATRAAAEACDLQQTYTNALVAAFAEPARIPMVLPDDRDVVRATVATCWRADPENARLCLIRSTLHLDTVLLSPALYAEIEGRDGVQALAEPAPLEFGDDGTLLTRCADFH